VYKRFFKRFLDFIVALLGFIVLSPIFIIVFIGLSVANKGKPFFFQLRPGKDQKLFKIIKFKTMTDDKDEHGNLLPDERRLTGIGKFARTTSLDEVPQLFNVIKGDMSLIGPRPLLPKYLELYNSAEMKRQSVRPGITGLTAVRGRNNISWHTKMQLDITYVENLSFSLDIEILMLTVKKVVLREGVAKEGFATTDSFESYCLQNPDRSYDY
jgi:lipopolysaccharide/colanic/teichoic acid biosynthesis glycosyltransferase